MPNNPYPSNSQLREERLADLLLDEQDKAVQAFRAALTTFAFVFDRLHFPLGSPVVGYDTQDINGMIADWMILRHDYADTAADMAQAEGAF